jgi:hypothetical protein
LGGIAMIVRMTQRFRENKAAPVPRNESGAPHHSEETTDVGFLCLYFSSLEGLHFSRPDRVTAVTNDK